MGRISDAEAAALLSDDTPTAPLKFPLGIVPEPMRPYLELIRLEKVRVLKTTRAAFVHALRQPTGIKLMFWPFGARARGPQQNESTNNFSEQLGD